MTLVAGLALVAGCSRSAPSNEPPAAPQPPGTGPTPSASCEDLFRPPPGAKELCNEHVLGENLEISWRSWSSPKPSAEVFAPYRARLASCPEVSQPTPGHLVLGPARLRIHDVGEQYPTCETKPAAGDKTVVIVSYGTPR